MKNSQMLWSEEPSILQLAPTNPKKTNCRNPPHSRTFGRDAVESKMIIYYHYQQIFHQQINLHCHHSSLKRVLERRHWEGNYRSISRAGDTARSSGSRNLYRDCNASSGNSNWKHSDVIEDEILKQKTASVNSLTFHVNLNYWSLG